MFDLYSSLVASDCFTPCSVRKNNYSIIYDIFAKLCPTFKIVLLTGLDWGKLQRNFHYSFHLALNELLSFGLLVLIMRLYVYRLPRSKPPGFPPSWRPIHHHQLIPSSRQLLVRHPSTWSRSVVLRR